MSNIYSDDIHQNFVDSKKAVALPRYIGYDPRTRAIIIIDSIDMAKKIFKDVEGVVLLEVGGAYGSLPKFLESVGLTENGLIQS